MSDFNPIKTIRDYFDDSTYAPIVAAGDKNSIEYKTKGFTNLIEYGRERLDLSPAYKLRFLSPSYANKKGKQVMDLVIGYINEEFVEVVTSKWGNALQIETNAVEFFTQTFLNKSLKSMLMYRQIWQGNDPFSGKFVVHFNAEKDAYQDVVLPTRALEKMASPELGPVIKGIDWNTLTPPVQSAKNPQNGIVVSVGTWFEYVGVIFTNVLSRFEDRMSKDGYPLHSTVEINYQLVNPVVKGDFI